MDLKKLSVIDCHCDTLTQMENDESLSDHNGAVTLQRMQGYGSYIQLFAAWIDDIDPAPLKTVLFVIDWFYQELQKHQDSMMQVLTAEDIERTQKHGKVGAMLSVENGNCLEGDISNLNHLYRLGVRAMTLTWNSTNEIADGISESRGAGLTAFGREVVTEMNRLGIIVDVSHLSEKGFLDVLSLSDKPVMASHSNSRTCASHQRNLTDEQIRLLSEKGGVTGLNLYPVFLNDSGVADLEDCLRHIEHIVKVGGEDSLVLGSDFDGFSTAPVVGLADPGEYVRLFDLLQKRGYSERFIEKLAHKNFIRFVKNILN